MEQTSLEISSKVHLELHEVESEHNMGEQGADSSQEQSRPSSVAQLDATEESRPVRRSGDGDSLCRVAALSAPSTAFGSPLPQKEA